jgi:hypothetical protein
MRACEKKGPFAMRDDLLQILLDLYGVLAVLVLRPWS